MALPPTGVLRVSRGTFDPARFTDVDRMAHETGAYLIPAIRRLPGLAAYFREMIVDARYAAEAVGVEFSPIVNYPIAWSI